MRQLRLRLSVARFECFACIVRADLLPRSISTDEAEGAKELELAKRLQETAMLFETFLDGTNVAHRALTTVYQSQLKRPADLSRSFPLQGGKEGGTHALIRNPSG